MIAIYQVKASPEGTAIRMWEWKGADLPFESGGAADGAGFDGENLPRKTVNLIKTTDLI